VHSYDTLLRFPFGSTPMLVDEQLVYGKSFLARIGTECAPRNLAGRLKRVVHIGHRFSHPFRGFTRCSDLLHMIHKLLVRVALDHLHIPFVNAVPVSALKPLV
jgi:hypothetical protein